MKKTNPSIKWHFIFKNAAKEQRLISLKSFSKWNVKQMHYGSSHAIPQEEGRVSFPVKTGKFMLTSGFSTEAQLTANVFYQSQGFTAPLEERKPTTLPSTYSITMHRCRLVSKEQNMLTTKGFSANVRISLSTKACWIWFLRIRFCLLIFFMAKRWRVVLCRTRYTALQNHTERKRSILSSNCFAVGLGLDSCGFVGVFYTVMLLFWMDPDRLIYDSRKSCFSDKLL